MAALIDHLVGAGWRTVTIGRGENLTAEEFPHIDLADGPDQLRSAGKQAEAAWSDDARLGATVTMPRGETYTGATLVNMYLAELPGHAWDLAAATGELDQLDAKLAPRALQAAGATLKPGYRHLMGPGNPYGAEVEAPSDATDWERFAAFMGHQPRS